MTRLAVIGGTGLTALEGLEIHHSDMLGTPWGTPSGPVLRGTLNGVEILFLARHGPHHSLPPHRVNYRANIWALKDLEVTHVLAIAAVGGIDVKLPAASLVVPDQIIDYTWGREHTFFDGKRGDVVHVDFTYPYDASLRAAVVESARQSGCPVHDGGTYGTTQGPRLESAAEVQRLARDGCHVVGMTGMPEASLAREAELAYAHCAVIVNPAAGLGPSTISMDDIRTQVTVGMGHVRVMLARLVTRIKQL